MLNSKWNEQMGVARRGTSLGKKKRLSREGRKGQVENCSLGSLKAAGPGLKLDPHLGRARDIETNCKRRRARVLSPALKGPPQEVLILPVADTPHQQLRGEKPSFRLSGGERCWKSGPPSSSEGGLISKPPHGRKDKNVSKKEGCLLSFHLGID